MKTVTSRFSQLPATKMGRWSAGVMIAFLVMIMLKTTLFFPLPSMLIMAIGIGPILDLRPIRVANWLPALILAPALVAVLHALGISGF